MLGFSTLANIIGVCIYIKKNIRCGSTVDVEVGQVEIPVDQAAHAVHIEQEPDEGVALSTPPPEVS